MPEKVEDDGTIRKVIESPNAAFGIIVLPRRAFRASGRLQLLHDLPCPGKKWLMLPRRQCRTRCPALSSGLLEAARIELSRYHTGSNFARDLYQLTTKIITYVHIHGQKTLWHHLTKTFMVTESVSLARSVLFIVPLDGWKRRAQAATKRGNFPG